VIFFIIYFTHFDGYLMFK